MSAIAIGTRRGQKAVMKAKTRETHCHVLGASGQGKSYFLEHLIRQDIQNGSGVCVIDPHGELYDNLVAWLAEQQIDRYRQVHLINPRDEQWAVGFNPLSLGESDPTVRVGAMVSACLKVWGGADATQTPRLAKCLRAVFYALAYHRLSLLEAKQLTSYATADVRRRLTETLPNPAFREEWRELNAYPQRDFLSYFESTNSRLLPFISSPVLARMVGQTEQVLDFQKCMDERHIVLVNLATQDKYEEEDARLLGTMLFSDLFFAAKRRDLAVAKRTPFYCYVDECADFLTEDVARMLDQTRKFGLHLILAHQRLEQLRRYGENLYNAVMAGAQSKVVFKVDEDDTAEALARFLFRKELELEEPKRILDKPVVVAQTPVWLHSESRTDSESEGANEGGGESTYHPEEGDPSGITQSSQWSRAYNRTSSDTSGRSQALANQFEIMPTTVYSLEEQIHKAIVSVRSLKQRTAIGYLSEQGKPFRFSTIPIRRGAVLPSQVAHFVERVQHQSAFAIPAETAAAEVAQRRRQVIEGEPLADEEEAFWGGAAPRVIE